MMNLTERIALDIMHHLSRLTDGDRVFAPIQGRAELYWELRNQLEKIVERRLVEALKEERYS